MKQPNSYGSVHKLPGKRRKPWRARKTSGWLLDEQSGTVKQQYLTIGYYATKQEALVALANYNENPYDINTNSITFSEVYENGLWNILRPLCPLPRERGNLLITTASPSGICE